MYFLTDQVNETTCLFVFCRFLESPDFIHLGIGGPLVSGGPGCCAGCLRLLGHVSQRDAGVERRCRGVFIGEKIGATVVVTSMSLAEDATTTKEAKTATH